MDSVYAHNCLFFGLFNFKLNLIEAVNCTMEKYYSLKLARADTADHISGTAA